MSDDLALLLSELHHLRVAVRALTDVVCPRADKAAPDYETVLELVRAIDACVNKPDGTTRTFNVADLRRHAGDPFQYRLKNAIESANGADGTWQDLGNLLKSILLKRYDGLVVVKHGSDSEGSILEVRKWTGDQGD